MIALSGTDSTKILPFGAAIIFFPFWQAETEFVPNSFEALPILIPNQFCSLDLYVLQPDGLDHLVA